MEKRYSFQKFEKKIYQFWEKGNFFKPRFFNKKKRFCIIMPPPNANAPLHIGHAVFVTLEDIMIRYQRMRGKAVLWLPGADHAGFETQVVFEKELEKQGKTRFQFPPKVLYKMMWLFTQKNKKIMEQQLKQLGASCDWSRKRFTLEPKVIKVVNQTFKKLYQRGLIYRGKRVINWCVHHQTSLSDLEVIYKEEKTKLVYIKYPIKNSNNYLVVATTRPETMLGDTAVAVNPKDKRYQFLVKRKISLYLPLTKRIIPLISDESVDSNFGSGAVKVTPAHDPTDFEIGQRHHLEIIQVIGQDRRMTKEAGKDYECLSVPEARQKIIDDLRKRGLLVKEEDYLHSIPICYKCKNIIEPLISDQWFIKIKPLAEKAIKVVKEKKIKFIPNYFEKTFSHWMRNIKDWNISRQIVWGIKIPVWYCQEKKNKKCQSQKGIIISDKKLTKCPYCKGKKIIPESDTFDTWFSSGQWPFISLGYPHSKDYKFFYPTSVMETGWDILFFWVARMIMLALFCTKKIPFKIVYLHGLVRDKDRQKMSKSKGNVINPLGVVSLYGVDALRMALVFGVSPGRDIILSEEKIINQQKFITKIWNAARFILQNLNKNFNPHKVYSYRLLTKEDKWILKELKKTIKKTSQNMEKFRFHEAIQELYHFFWHKFCDKCIENAKQRLYSEKSSLKEKEAVQWLLYTILLTSLKLLHPFIPFVTETIYQKIPYKPKKALIIESWPKTTRI